MTVRGYLVGSPADPQAAPVPNAYRWATVTDASPLEIQLDGDSLPLASEPDCLIDPLTLAVGDRVWTQIYGRRVIVHGAQGGGLGPHAYPNPWPNEQMARVAPNGGSSTTSVTQVDWPIAHGGPLVVSLTKRAAATRVIVDVTVGGYVTTPGAITPWNVKADVGTQIDVIWAFWNVASQHLAWSGVAEFTGLAAGARTFTLQVRTNGNALYYNSDDNFTMTAREVAP